MTMLPQQEIYQSPLAMLERLKVQQKRQQRSI